VLIPLSLHLVAFGLFATDVAIRAVRLRVLAPGTTLTLGQAIAVNAYGEAASAVTPARAGGNPARFVALLRDGVSAPRALAALATELFIDWVLLAAAAVVLLMAWGETAATGARRLAELAATPHARVLVVAVLVLAAASVVALRWYRRRRPAQGLAPSLAGAWRAARNLGWHRVSGSAALTGLSMIARTAILPVLAAGLASPGLDPPAVVVGSFALLYGQLVLPTPAGAGGVELGFVGGFAGALGPAAVAELLLTWRIYTLILGAGLGALLLARAAIVRRAAKTPSPYESSSSVNVRSQL
jgi:uncharacterized membrane protein YbhN (UPF0104 family)